MSFKIVDLSDQIYRELDEPEDINVASIAFWIRSNIYQLNILLNKEYQINSNSLEIEPDTFSGLEGSILKKLYSIHYYTRLYKKTLGSASLDSVVSVTDDGSTVVKINKNELAKNYAQLKNQEVDSLNKLIDLYKINSASPIQVAGDDVVSADLKLYNKSPRTRD